MKQTLFFSAMVLLLQFATALAQTFPRVGPAKLLYSSDQIPNVKDGSEPYADSTLLADAPIAMIRSDDLSTIHFVEASYSISWRFKTSAITPNPSDFLGLKTPDYSNNAHGGSHCCLFGRSDSLSDIGLVPTDTNWVGLYLMNIYKDKNGNLLGFLHVEDQRPCAYAGEYCPATRWSIALAVLPHRWLTDSGWTYQQWLRSKWLFLGTVIHPHYHDRSNIGGAPYFTKDGYFYVFFNEHIVDSTTNPPNKNHISFLSAARANIDSVMSAALFHHRADSSLWHKYTGGSCGAPTGNACWNIRGDSIGIGAEIIPHGAYGKDSHTDAVYSFTEHKYYVLTSEARQSANGPQNLIMFSSDDPVHWGNPVTIDTDKTISDLHGALFNTFYPSILPVNWREGSDDGREVGREFYVIYHISPIFASSPHTGAVVVHDRLYRRKVTLSADISPITTSILNSD